MVAAHTFTSVTLTFTVFSRQRSYSTFEDGHVSLVFYGLQVGLGLTHISNGLSWKADATRKRKHPEVKGDGMSRICAWCKAELPTANGEPPHDITRCFCPTCREYFSRPQTPKSLQQYLDEIGFPILDG